MTSSGYPRSSGQPGTAVERLASVGSRKPSVVVLVVEDDSEIAELIKLHLEDLPANVTVVSDGYEGLREARAGRFDLIVLDVRLPGRDGLEICQILRVEKIHPPILMVSARGSDADRIIGLQLGADDYLLAANLDEV